MMSSDRKQLSNQSMEAILRIRNYGATLNDNAHEKAMEMFLTEYPNGDIRKGKRRVSGYEKGPRQKKEKKKRGLTLNLDTSSEDESEDENEARDLEIRPGEEIDIDTDSSDESSDDDNDIPISDDDDAF